MVTYNKHVKIEDKPSMVPAGVEKSVRAAVEKDDRILAILEDMGFPFGTDVDRSRN